MSCGMTARGRDMFSMQQRADNHIVLDRQAMERPHVLEGASDAAPADLI